MKNSNDAHLSFGSASFLGVPLVYEAFSWQHGVFVGAAMRSEATAAAEHKGQHQILVLMERTAAGTRFRLQPRVSRGNIHLLMASL